MHYIVAGCMLCIHSGGFRRPVRHQRLLRGGDDACSAVDRLLACPLGLENGLFDGFSRAGGVGLCCGFVDVSCFLWSCFRCCVFWCHGDVFGRSFSSSGGTSLMGSDTEDAYTQNASLLRRVHYLFIRVEQPVEKASSSRALLRQTVVIVLSKQPCSSTRNNSFNQTDDPFETIPSVFLTIFSERFLIYLFVFFIFLAETRRRVVILQPRCR